MNANNRLIALAIGIMSVGWLNAVYRFTAGVANPRTVMGVSVLVSAALVALQTVRNRLEAWESGQSLRQQYTAIPGKPVLTDLISVIAIIVGLLLAASYLDIYTAPFSVYMLLGGVGLSIAIAVLIKTHTF